MPESRKNRILGIIVVAVELALVATAAAGRAPRIQRASGATITPPTTLKCSEITSQILGRAVSYCVALPGGYDPQDSRRYPVVYYLHGLFENERTWGERGGEAILDGLLEQAQVGKFLVVCPDGGKTFYINSLDGKVRYEDFFIQEFVPAIDAAYRTQPDRLHRGIAGDSMGGYGALHLAMRHPDVFGTCTAQSAALIVEFPSPLPTEGRWAFYSRILELPFGSPLSQPYFDQNNPLTLVRNPERFANLKLYFDCGDADRYGFEEGAKLLDSTLKGKNFPHEFVLRTGGHGWSYLEQYMKYALLFQWSHISGPDLRATSLLPTSLSSDAIGRRGARQ